MDNIITIDLDSQKKTITVNLIDTLWNPFFLNSLIDEIEMTAQTFFKMNRKDGKKTYGDE